MELFITAHESKFKKDCFNPALISIFVFYKVKMYREQHIILQHAFVLNCTRGVRSEKFWKTSLIIMALQRTPTLPIGSYNVTFLDLINGTV